MTNIKSYTDIEQSKKLAEILSLESADMYYPWYIEEDRDNIKSGHRISIPSIGNFIHKVNILPCWSLAALLGVLPKGTRLLKSTNISSVNDTKYHCDCPKGNIDKWFDNPIDACYKMIIKLHEKNLL